LGRRGRHRLAQIKPKRMKDERTYKIIGAAMEVHKNITAIAIQDRSGWIGPLEIS